MVLSVDRLLIIRLLTSSQKPDVVVAYHQVMRRSVIATLALIVTLVASPATTRASAEESSRDIPGDSLPGPRVTSTVGGNIFDRVWSIDLAEGKVALFRLSGEVGAELGLYVFNSLAQSVYSSTPIATSARPGASQVVTAVLPAGRYFVNVNGRNSDRAYEFTLTTSLYSDITPPLIAARFADNRDRFSTPFADLEPRAYDSLSGITHLRYAVESSDWSGWIPFSGGLYRVPLPSQEGLITIRIQVRNGVELLSEVNTLSATIDRKSPTFRSVADLARQLSYSTIPRLTYLFDEPMDPTSFEDSVILRDISGQIFSTSCTYEFLVLTVTCLPTAELTFGRTYLVDFQGARDTAGNTTIDASPQTLAVLQRTSIRMELVATSLKVGSTAVIKVTATNIPLGSTLVLETRPSEQDEWVALATMRINRNRVASATISPSKSAEYRVRYLGDLDRATSVSRSASVVVSPDLRLERPRTSSIVRTTGELVNLKGQIDPFNAAVNLVLLRCKARFVSCVAVSTTSLTSDSAGRHAATWVAEFGYWKLRLVAEAQDGMRKATSRTIRISVR